MREWTRQHKLDKFCRFSVAAGFVDGLVVFLLMVVDDGLHRQPGKGWVPLREQQRVPQQSHVAVAVREQMNEFKLIVGLLTKCHIIMG